MSYFVVKSDVREANTRKVKLTDLKFAIDYQHRLLIETMEKHQSVVEIDYVRLLAWHDLLINVVASMIDIFYEVEGYEGCGASSLRQFITDELLNSTGVGKD